ncbi:hypothetical protein ACN38_g6526 [Penicillium nordicum]|uniref:Uncharacterized protein n=1 Tax=Penicillium nordicum TaxID=229535 RepID=A0A0M8NZT2_9EURO|nr:hypothetical protein ACN38_g6526 [Penicillium nordicum]
MTAVLPGLNVISAVDQAGASISQEVYPNIGPNPPKPLASPSLQVPLSPVATLVAWIEPTSPIASLIRVIAPNDILLPQQLRVDRATKALVITWG